MMTCRGKQRAEPAVKRGSATGGRPKDDTQTHRKALLRLHQHHAHHQPAPTTVTKLLRVAQTQVVAMAASRRPCNLLLRRPAWGLYYTGRPSASGRDHEEAGEERAGRFWSDRTADGRPGRGNMSNKVCASVNSQVSCWGAAPGSVAHLLLFVLQERRNKISGTPTLVHLIALIRLCGGKKIVLDLGITAASFCWFTWFWKRDSAPVKAKLHQPRSELNSDVVCGVKVAYLRSRGP